MNYHTFTQPYVPAWFRNAGVIECRDCEGYGVIDKTPHLHGNDPDRRIVDCEECEGQGHHACATCGFDVPTAGFDCLVCASVYELSADDLVKIKPADLAAAFVRAIEAARGEVACGNL